MRKITLEDVRAYVASLSPECQKIYREAEDIAKETEDTLSEEFQIAVGAVEVFWDRAEQRAAL